MQMAARLRREITEGQRAAGTPVPSITAMSAEYGYSRGTCAHALRLLEAEGVLVRFPGLGYFVAAGAGD
jgi:DNA-binding GntR family transcriptional regulator